MRNLTLILLALLIGISPMLALGGQGRSSAEDCPLTEAVVVEESRAKPVYAAPEAAPLRETRSSEPRTRLRWQSLVPGMIK
jgi:hypothetical protein